VTKPLVSIVIPAYDAAPFLREALDSLLAQTYDNIEIILLDDASTDATPEIAAEYTGAIAYVRQLTNLGIYDNINVGISLAHGDLIATYHADDIYLPTIVEAQVNYLNAHPEVGAVFCADILVDAEGLEYARLVLPPETRGEKPLDYPTVLNALLTYKNRFLVSPTMMVRASVHHEVGVYRQVQYRNTSDVEMWLRIARRYPIAVIESRLMKYRQFLHHPRRIPRSGRQCAGHASVARKLRSSSIGRPSDERDQLLHQGSTIRRATRAARRADQRDFAGNAGPEMAAPGANCRDVGTATTTASGDLRTFDVRALARKATAEAHGMIGAIEDGVRVPTRAASADSRRRHHRSAAGSSCHGFTHCA
jgi:glycosyltransferase involved in cell wall biosynthesis